MGDVSGRGHFNKMARDGHWASYKVPSGLEKGMGQMQQVWSERDGSGHRDPGQTLSGWLVMGGGNGEKVEGSGLKEGGFVSVSF